MKPWKSAIMTRATASGDSAGDRAPLACPSAAARRASPAGGRRRRAPGAAGADCAAPRPRSAAPRAAAGARAGSRSRAKKSRASRRSTCGQVAGLARRRDQRHLERVAVGADGVDDRVLAGEVAVDRARAEPRLAHDVVHGGAVEALAREAGHGGVEDLLPPRLAMRGAHLGHASPPRRAAADRADDRAVEGVAAAGVAQVAGAVLARADIRRRSAMPRAARYAGSSAGSRPKVHGSPARRSVRGRVAARPRTARCRRAARGVRR